MSDTMEHDIRLKISHTLDCELGLDKQSLTVSGSTIRQHAPH